VKSDLAFHFYNKNKHDDWCYAKSLLDAKVSVKKTMKRNIFSDLFESFNSLAEVRTGKVTRRSHKVEINKLPAVTADELVEIREHLHLSRPIFAMYMRTNVRTLENWEQGRAKPNAQATTLIRLVQKYPETVGHLAALA